MSFFRYSKVLTSLCYFVKDLAGIEDFIETGTFVGESAEVASRSFKNVYTIEVSNQLYDEVKIKFGNIPNINFICGDSKTEIPKLVSKVKCPAFFFLDAHWSQGSTMGKEEGECPLLQELSMIKNNFTDPFILIDDLDCFWKPMMDPYDQSLWPSLLDITSLFNKEDWYATIIDYRLFLIPNKYRISVMKKLKELIYT